MRVGPDLGSAAAHAGMIRRGLETASSILQDVPFAADCHDGPITEGRHSEERADSARAGDDAPARAVPLLNGEADGPDVVGGDGRDPVQDNVGARVGDDAPARAIPVLDQRIGGGKVVGP
jgi:hypothetical protein